MFLLGIVLLAVTGVIFWRIWREGRGPWEWSFFLTIFPVVLAMVGVKMIGYQDVNWFWFVLGAAFVSVSGGVARRAIVNKKSRLTLVIIASFLLVLGGIILWNEQRGPSGRFDEFGIVQNSTPTPHGTAAVGVFHFLT